MTTGTVKTQGTHLFLANPIPDPDTIVKFACPTGISGLGGAKDQIEDTCLDELGDKTYVPGLGNPGQVTVPFNLIPREMSHQLLFTLKKRGDVLNWLAGLSESAEAPVTIDSDGLIVAPTPLTRTWLAFAGFISDVNIDIATNEIVRGTLTIQRSGEVTPYWFTPA